MQLAITPEHKDLADSVRSLVARVAPSEVLHAALETPIDNPPPYWQAAAEQGLQGVHLAESVGGQGFGILELAAGLIFGRAGEGEYDDEIVRRADVTALRRKVVATVDDSIDEAAADVTALLEDGRREHVFVEHAIGSLERPMSDKDLEMKFHSLADPVIGKSKADALIAACWNLGAARNVQALVEKARP